MLLSTLSASLLGNFLTGQGAIAKSRRRRINRAGKGRGINRADEGVVRAGYVCRSLNSSTKNWLLMLPHLLTNFQIQKYDQNEPRFNGVYFRDNLPKIKDGAYVINLDRHSDIRTHWIAFWLDNNNITYFDSFGVEHIPKQI